MMTDRNNIQHLLDCFMSGTTTEQEERLLADYFNSATDIPDEWAAYAVLFRGFRNQAQTKPQPRHRRLVWLYPAIGAVAASVLLLVSLGIISNNQNDEGNSLVAQTDTTIVCPQTETKETEIHQQEKKESKEMADTVKRVKEILRMARTPKRYMAKREKQAEPVVESEVIDATDLAEQAIAEEERRLEMEMMARMNGSLQDDYLKMTREIRERGNNMTQQATIAMSNEE